MPNVLAGISTINKKAQVSSTGKKKLCAFIVFACMLINGFGLSAGEASKQSAVLAGASVAAAMIIKVITDATDTMIAVSKNVSERIGNALFGESGKDNVGKTENNKSEDGAGDSNAAAAETSIRKAVEKNELFAMHIWLADRDIIKLTGRYKIPDGGGGGAMPFLLFLLFIIGIRHRKGLDDIALRAKEIFNIGKIKISA